MRAKIEFTPSQLVGMEEALLFGEMPKTAALIEGNIRKLGFKPEDIKIMLRKVLMWTRTRALRSTFQPI